MGWTDDIWTSWWELGEPPSTARNMKHIGDFMYEPWETNSFVFWKDRIDTGLLSVLSYSDDPASRAMVVDLTICAQDMMRLILMLMYAAQDLREIITVTPKTKEEVFDLWLERASEMNL